ncbi:MAG: trypsin-like peptidase domain-containing protein [Candidatus Andersenbacteria bacterium]
MEQQAVSVIGSQKNKAPDPGSLRHSGRWVGVAVLSVVLGFGGGTLGGYLFGRTIVVQGDGSSASLRQSIRVDETSATIDAVNKVSPAVVSIVGVPDQQSSFYGFQGFGQQKTAGSGFILTKDGLIATNKHVVLDKNLSYTVGLADGRTLDASVVSLDPSFDFAIIKVEATDLPTIELGSSDATKIGERVIAIGNAFGEFQNTVTTGVVSARNRTIQASDGIARVELLEGLIQTDAAINPGNSGGPLVNVAGQVIGVNTATDTASENIGFAIPIDDAKVAIESVIAQGKIVRPLLGVRYVNLNKEVADLNNIDTDKGAYVVADRAPAVVPDSPAAKLGIKEGDIITALDDKEIKPDRSLATLLRTYHPGDTVTLHWKSGGKEHSERVTLDSIGN